MRKIWLIGWKDVTLAFRDTAALVLMLAAPFALTLGLGFVTGRFSRSGSGGLSGIPVILVNQDEGVLGRALVKLFRSDELGDLVFAVLKDDPAVARQYVDDDQSAAAVIIPAGFTESIIPSAGAVPAGGVVPIEFHANPSRPTSVGVIKTIVDGFISQVEAGRMAGQVVATQLAGHGLAAGPEAARIGGAAGMQEATAPRTLLELRTAEGEEGREFDMLGYMAPGMALMFLMFTVANGGRTLLAERAQGTLPRLLVSPTRAAQVLGGKVLGIYLTGVAQMLILIGASALFFRVSWGDPLTIVALVLAAVLGAAGWGLLITALAKTPGQVSTVGTALMLIFGILGGSFFPLEGMPRWFQILARITPNSWGLDGFATLARGGRLADIAGPLAGLLAMGALLFAIALIVYNRRGLAEA